LAPWLQERGLSFEAVAIGGSSLMLLGLINRPTRDLAVAGLVYCGDYVKADPMPPQLVDAAADVGNALGLPANWLNPGPTSMVDTGFPEGFASRVEVRQYGGLTLHIASRYDQIFLKLTPRRTSHQAASTPTTFGGYTQRARS